MYGKVELDSSLAFRFAQSLRLAIPYRRWVGMHTELWVPAGELVEFNQNIVGTIEVIAEFR